MKPYRETSEEEWEVEVLEEKHTDAHFSYIS